MSVPFSRDERAVSEVIGYILSFMIAFALLVIALYGFKLVADQENEKGTQTHFADIGNRVAAAVLAAADLGAARAASDPNAHSQQFSLEQRVRVPSVIRGAQYSVTLSSSTVTVRTTGGSQISSTAVLFNLKVPAAGTCTIADAVCTLAGTVISGDGDILVKYQFNRNGPLGACTTSPANCITIQ